MLPVVLQYFLYVQSSREVLGELRSISSVLTLLSVNELAFFPEQ